MIKNTDEETVVHLMKTIGMKPLYDARPVELVHELRRQMCGNWDFDNYHHNEKKRAVPHAIDEVGVDIMEKADDVVRGTRSKKGKWVKTRVEPWPCTQNRINAIY